jgi:hypothetical protein
MSHHSDIWNGYKPTNAQTERAIEALRNGILDNANDLAAALDRIIALEKRVEELSNVEPS